jgi:tRNA (adenine22-N1)-methyltransferase
VSGKLDDRLIAVAQQIRSSTHADIGSDHGSLLVELLRSERIKLGIAIENKQLPFENSVRALRGLRAEVRLGDGLDALDLGEADSLSICGLGAESIRDILLKHPERIPDNIVLQVFHKPEVIRGWALEHGFHLLSETITRGPRHYTILSYRRCENREQRDPAYENVDLKSALLFGPFVLQREDRQFDLQLQNEEVWWRNFDQLSVEAAERLKLLQKAMADRQIEPLPGVNC